MSNKRLRKKHAANWSNCPLCGRPLPPDPQRCVVGSSGRAICERCLLVAERIKGICCSPVSVPDNRSSSLPFPSQILKQLDEYIVGQAAAKRTVVMALWKQVLRSRGDDLPNTSLLLYGPTGCGKTALIREAAALMGLPFLVFDSTSISETGYRGRDAADMVNDLVKRCGSVKQASFGVIFLDEIDKLAANDFNSSRASYCRGTQFSLLKLIEGLEVETDNGKINTKNILFLFGGAFSTLTSRHCAKPKATPVGFLQEKSPAKLSESRILLPEDFVAYGMEPEFMGRVGRCIGLDALTQEQMKQVLLESRLSVYRMYQKYFHQKGKHLDMSNEDLDRIVKAASQRGMGARGLNALVEAWVEPQLELLAEELHEHVG